MLIAKLTERAQECRRCDPHTTFALDRFDKNCSRRRPDRALDRFKVTKRDLVEAVDRRSEAFQIFLVTGCGDCSQSAPMEGAFKCDDAIPLGLAGGRLILALHLDRALDRLSAGILEEHGVGKADRAQPIGELFAFRDAEKVETCQTLCACLVSASARCGCAWPSALTATPAVKSRYRSPSAVNSHAPSPRSNARSTRAYVGNRCELTALCFRRTYRFARGLVQTVSTFRHHARRKEMCRLAGRHFFHSIARPCAVNTANDPLNPDSIAPQPQILRENCW